MVHTLFKNCLQFHLHMFSVLKRVYVEIIFEIVTFVVRELFSFNLDEGRNGTWTLEHQTRYPFDLYGYGWVSRRSMLHSMISAINGQLYSFHEINGGGTFAIFKSGQWVPLNTTQIDHNEAVVYAIPYLVRNDFSEATLKRGQ